MANIVADQFVETLVAAGVKRIYGIVGDSLNGLTDAIRRHGKIEWVHVRHEEVAAFAAGAEAHLTGDSPFAPGAAGRAICISSMVCSIVIARAFRCWPSLHISPRPRSAAAIFRRRIPRSLFKECSHYCEFVSVAQSDAAQRSRPRSAKRSASAACRSW